MTWPGIANSGELFFATQDNAFHDFGELRGDISGIYSAVEVQAIRGETVNSATPASGWLLQHDGNEWVPTPLSNIDLDDHTVLSPRHTDTNPDAIVRGDILYASGTTPLWARLPLGTAEFVLYSDGTDAVYTRLGPNTPFELGTAGAPAMTFTGDLDTGWSAAVANSLVGSASGVALLTLEGNDGRITLNGGQVVKTRTIAASETMGRDDYVALVTAAPVTVTLNDSPSTGQIVVVKDQGGNASAANQILIDANGSTIDGNAVIAIRRAYGSFTLMYNGSTWNVI